MIKDATLADVPKLVAYGQQFWHQTYYFKAGVDYDVDSITAMTEELVENGIVLYAEEDDKVIALMLVIIAPFPMNHNYKIAVEWVFYVDEAYRRTGMGVTLIKAAEAILINKRVKFFSMVSLTGVTPKAANTLYESLGYQHCEATFTKELKWP